VAVLHSLYLGYELIVLLKTLLWLWNVEAPFVYSNLCLSVMVDSISCTMYNIYIMVMLLALFNRTKIKYMITSESQRLDCYV
jgi:hypothetical protein